MGAVKIRSADKWFSLCIRERVAWFCERCGRDTPQDKRMGLHCSHYHGRGKWSTRFNSDNCEALCYGCHMHLTANPHKHQQRQLLKLGDGLYDILNEKAQDLKFGRTVKRDQKLVAKHYREQHKLQLEARAQGEMGRVDFQNWG